MAEFEYRITPEPGSDDRDAIIAAVNELLRKETELAQPSVWRLAGWAERGIGIADLGRWVPDHRRWALSARLPGGGRVFPGLYGRGDAK